MTVVDVDFCFIRGGDGVQDRRAGQRKHKIKKKYRTISGLAEGSLKRLLKRVRVVQVKQRTVDRFVAGKKFLR